MIEEEETPDISLRNLMIPMAMNAETLYLRVLQILSVRICENLMLQAAMVEKSLPASCLKPEKKKLWLLQKESVLQ